MDSSTNRVATDHYSRSQIVLHWTIVALIVVQLLSHEAMEEAFDAAGGPIAGVTADPVAILHALSGWAVFILMLIRVALRLRLGAPPLPADLPQVQKLGAHASHYAFYALLILLPPTGFAAIYFDSERLAGLHGLLVTLLWIVLALHVAGALYHAFIRRDGVFQRIVVPR